MELKWLEDLQILLAEGSFSRAAERRYVTQPAFSRRIRALEDWLGLAIVDRTRQPIRIHPAALKCEPELNALVARFYEFRSRLQTESMAGRGVTVAAQHSLAASTFPELAARIASKIPDFGFQLRSGNGDECAGWCARGECDLLLGYRCPDGPSSAPAPDFEAFTLGTDLLVPVFGAGLYTATFNGRGKAAQPIPLIAYPASSFFGRALGRQCLPDLMRSQRVRWVCESAYATGIKGLVVAGLGMAWLPRSLVAEELRAGILKRPQASIASEAAMEICLFFRRSNRRAAMVIEQLDDLDA